MPSISVIIPTYRRPVLLDRAVKSVLTQSYQDFELIIVNDDLAHPINVSYDDPRIRVLANERTRGACGARNTGLAAAEGKFIAGLDDDDEFEPDRLLLLMQAYRPSYSFIASGLTAVGQNSQQRRFARTRDVSLQSLLWGNCIGAPVLTETSKMRTVGGYDEGLTSSQDWDLWIRLAEKWGDAFRIRQALYRQYVSHGTARISTGPGKLTGMKAMLQKHGAKMSRAQRKLQNLHINRESGNSDQLRRLLTLADPEIFILLSEEINGDLVGIVMTGFSSYILTDLRDANLARPPLAVLIPAYNAERWMADCLSALSKNSEPHDLVIVDDGSIQPIEQANLGLYSRRTVIIRLTENSGIVHALNAGLSFIISEGYEFIARQDVDDISRSERLSRQADFMVNNPNVGLCGSSVDIIDVGGARIGTALKKVDHEAIWNALCFANQFVHSTFFIRSACLREIGFYDRRFQGSEDYELALRIGRTYKLANLPEILLAYRVHSSSISGKRFPQAITNLRVTARHFRPYEWRSYLGIVKKLVLLPVSRSWIVKAKLLLGSWDKN